MHELAKELGLTNKECLDLCLTLGIGVKTHSSGIEEAQADRVRRRAQREGLVRDKQPEAPGRKRAKSDADDGGKPAAPKKAAPKKATAKKAAAKKAPAKEPAERAAKAPAAPAAEPPPGPPALAPPAAPAPSRSRGRGDWLFFFKPGDQLVRMGDDVAMGMVIRTVPRHAFADGTVGPAYVVQLPDGAGQRIVDADELERGGRLQ